jgi:hypothetical protein
MLLFDDTIDNSQKKIIQKCFREFAKGVGFFVLIQYLYNNSDHFTTMRENINICTPDFIQYLAEIATSKTNKIQIMGSIHTNHHSSGVLYDYDGNPIFVRDTYFRVLIDGVDGYRHILLTPPNISDPNKINNYYYSNTSMTCYLPPSHSFISPTFYPE